ncbi:MAG: serine hydrolase [Gammaproteobacteria bacterium]
MIGLLSRLLVAISVGCSAIACAYETPNDVPPESQWTIPSNAEIRELLAERMQHNGVGIVVGVIDSQGRRVVAYGESGSSNGRPLDGATVFQIGSLTKTFTTLLLADMVERGEVGLDDPASAYLPHGVAMPERGRPITLRDLATHMSGLPSMPTNFDIRADPDPYEGYTVEQLHEFLSSYDLDREPGADYAYSNLGVALLGRLLARRAGMEYEVLLTQRVLEPLEMESTSITLNDDQSRRLAPGHDTYLEPVHSWEMSTLPASGSLRSTANDTLKMIAAYLGYTDTSLKSAMALQLSERIPVDDLQQALGWGIRDDGIVGHSGGKEGYRSAVVFDPEAGTGAVVLANARTYDRPFNIALYLVSGEPLEPAPHAPADKRRTDLPVALLDTYEGRYELRNGDVLEVARKSSHLLIRYPSGAILEFFATAPHEFFYITGNDDITFEVDADGRVTGLTLYGDGKNAGEEEAAQRIGHVGPLLKMPTPGCRAPLRRRG